MARTSRQSIILDVISKNEIETQDELSQALENAGCKVTQATISRDIKELGLIKILSENTKRYKYSVIDSGTNIVSNRLTNIFKESVVYIKQAQNLVVIKTIKGMASAISGFIDKYNLDNVLGCVCGDDTVMVISENELYVPKIIEKINKVFVE